MRAPFRQLSRTARISVALGLNATLVAGEVLGGIAAHSSALLADGAHNLADVAALLLSLFALRLTLRAPTELRSFGYRRASILAALANVALLLVVTLAIGAFAIWRLAHTGTVRPSIVIPVALAAMVVNALGALVLMEGTRNANLGAAMLHLGADAVASAGVVLTGVIEAATGRLYVLDPVVSLLIAIGISVEAVRLGKESVDVLLESVPSDIDPSEVAGVIATVPGVESVHHLHCWSLSGSDRVLSAHILLTGHPSLEQAQVVGERVRRAIGERFTIEHATLELECELCDEGGETICTIEERTSA